MEGERPVLADGSATPPARGGALGALILLALLGVQSGMTLTLFGPDQPLQRLLDDQPIVSGLHPLHLYHGYLGAQALRERGTLCCYDPAFQAGYPKTPVFDSGSRPAELFLAVAGGGYRPAAYKVGLAVCCLLAPLLLLAAARGLGLGARAAAVASGLGLLVWWGTPGRTLLEAGDLDLMLAGLSGLVFVSLLVRFDRAPGLGAWLGLIGSGALACFAQPWFFLLPLALLPVYYLTVGARHGFGWHVALLGSLMAALAANAFWLIDWVEYWWIRCPLQVGTRALTHRTFHTLWECPWWGSPADRTVALGLVVGATVGVWLLNRSKQRPAARVLGLGTGCLLALAVGGLAWEPLGRIQATKLLAPALWFAVLPAVYAGAEAWRLAAARLARPGPVAVAGCGVVLVAAAGAYPSLSARSGWHAGGPPLAVGLRPEEQRVVQSLVALTGPEARILWEDHEERPGGVPASPPSRWTALLPVLTDRAFLGGLDPDGCVEHAYADLVDQRLAGTPISSWSDAALEEFCRRYNVGWVVAWSPAVVERFRAWPGAAVVASLPADGKTGYLFALRRSRSFVLKGQAQWLSADAGHVTLGDVVPEDGQVVLSLHYQTGLRATPGRVEVEREPDAHDPIPFVRLLLPGPVTRITLRWEGR
jgi:hypothetical protein